MLYNKKAQSGVFQSTKLVGNDLKIIDKNKTFSDEYVYILISMKFMFTFEYRTKKAITFESMQNVRISEKVRFSIYGIKSGTKFQLCGEDIMYI
ncbi:hypothetical protein D3233_10050 [Staphylococcus aureus]|uniref:hypothetical protein n=1 Tax=Staphylococcus aureus TaxID=1280 RepID=UPI00044B3B5B|nr:hypothetical protein [Staphylococcus aureus]EZT66058.1 hypothetical protein U885_01882 [Staphylococcus aureus 81629]EZU94799.1 hypothetical protein U920_02529 [Staphylococcus aureus 11S00627]EZV18996.1 hypothetical protein U926_01566 [Staphylococcus aureus 12S00881]EZV22810.1 hypothetical protein U928_01977 [Staphylococcus aureus 12S01153]EZV31647.1 hypothetical protein U931_01302 [Staphylococcus aureus 12-ST01988]